MENDYELIKNKYMYNLLFEEEVRLFYEYGLITEEQYEDIIKNKE